MKVPKTYKSKNKLTYWFLMAILAAVALLMFRSVLIAKDVSLENQRLIRTFLERQAVNKSAIIKTQNLILEQCK